MSRLGGIQQNLAGSMTFCIADKIIIFYYQTQSMDSRAAALVQLLPPHPLIPASEWSTRPLSDDLITPSAGV